MKIALVHDRLCGIGGSERVFQYICQAFPKADIYTLAYSPSKTFPYYKTRHIRTTWLNRFMKTSSVFRWSFPLAARVMGNLDLSSYDIVLSSSATTAKYVKAKKGKHICYCYIPTRALWHFTEYFGKSWKSSLVKPFLSLLKNNDYKIAQEIDHFITISKSSKEYINQYYNRDADVLFCPIETEKFYASPQRKEHYLIVSRLEHWKKVDYAIEAFNKNQRPLKVIGDGEERPRLKAMAKNNIEFLGEVDDATLAYEYSLCKAVIFTPFLEYGLIPLEANASGAPVICYGKGGITETMIPTDSNGKEKPTAVFFYEQTSEAVCDAILKFERFHFDSQDLIAHAAHWNIETFKKNLQTKLFSLF